MKSKNYKKINKNKIAIHYLHQTKKKKKMIQTLIDKVYNNEYTINDPSSLWNWFDVTFNITYLSGNAYI